jgi:hypothetical protein
VPSLALTIKKYIFLLKNLKGRCHLEDIGVDGRIILKSILKK